MDLAQLKEKASRLSAEGRLAPAEVLYRQLLGAQPRDAALWLKHAEVLKRLERRGPAVNSYRMAARLLMEQGHGQRAVACLKQALEQQPDDLDIVTEIIRCELAQRQEDLRRSQQTASVDFDFLPLEELPPVAERASFLELPAPARSPAMFQARPPREREAWPQVVRRSLGEVAIRPSPFSPWVVLTSTSEIDVRIQDDPLDEPAGWVDEPWK